MRYRTTKAALLLLPLTVLAACSDDNSDTNANNLALNDQGMNGQVASDQDASDQDMSEQDANDQGSSEQDANDQGSSEQDANDQGSSEQDANDQGSSEQDMNNLDSSGQNDSIPDTDDDPAVPDSGAVNTDPVDQSVIRADTWEAILRNVVALTNADRALERHNMVLDRVVSLSELVMAETVFEDTSGTLASLGLTMQPLADPDNRFVVDYLCNSGGILNVTLSPGVNNYAIVSDNCAIDGDVYNGGFTHFGSGREGVSSTLNNTDVALADGTAYSLSGTYSTFFDRPGVRRSYEWADAAMMDQSESGNYIVESFNILSESASGTLGELLHSAAVQGSFSVSANWTDNQPVEVTVDLELGGAYPADEVNQNALPTQWTSGSITIAASDGSQLTLSPIATDPSSATVNVSGINEPQQVLWSNEYQVRCFADATVFPDCQ